MIRIVDCGSQLTQNIARRIREQGVYTEIVPFNTPTDKILSNGLEGLVISGGQFSVYDKNAPMYSRELLHTRFPTLGICYGQQSIAHLEGGKVSPTILREYGSAKIELMFESKLFNGVPNEFNVWMSHGDIVDKMPEGFIQLARSSSGHIAAMQGPNNIYAVQFHPEADHTDFGRAILGNFLDICAAKRDWDPEKDYDRLVLATQEQISGKIGVGGISGGVDSTTASVFVGRLAGNSYHPIFVDNGLLRLDEAAQVRKILDPFGLNVTYVDASERFLTKLRGITDPEEKRKIIGHEFIAVFEEEANRIAGASYLVQGTLYPDVIESVPLYGSSSKIKSHHNVGGLPEKMNLKLVEPFRMMFKDEVRKVGEGRLRLPKEVVWRHPFPGPGLAIRIKGEVTRRKLDILRRADAILVEELKNRGLYYQISQAFATLLNAQTVGVMGDEGTYQEAVGIRAVISKDFMTADCFDFTKEQRVAISSRIINEVKGVNCVYYNWTQKPPGTIEME